jgi:hypothetical protein
VILPGAVEASIPSVPGFDSDTIITPATAQQFYALGYKFCLRYISLGKESPQHLSTQEASDILSSGLAFMPAQHVRNPGWSPSALLGERDGQNAATNAQLVGFLPGVNVWCDLEGVSGAAKPQNVIDYCQAWHSAS